MVERAYTIHPSFTVRGSAPVAPPVTQYLPPTDRAGQWAIRALDGRLEAVTGWRVGEPSP
ncbi:hypothetical protein MSHI_19130 [Mycobacterium shinjukuense]|uniref:Uncharacterized protein n=1 Tax=Mycobacterium shinjukuense TaxID=398694 RepID=A0A7I7MQE9_9MYCO|nr:hypothetical protein MSHI_19130 [Mycobacterium shinjukuense]